MSEATNVDNSTQREIVSNNSFAESSVENVSVSEPVVTESETKVNEAAPSPEGGHEATEGELPEYVKRRLGKEQKKYERELGRLKAELEAERTRHVSPQVQMSSGAPGGYEDPLVPGEYVDPNTPEGQWLAAYHQKVSQRISVQEKQQQEYQQKEIDNKLTAYAIDSFEEAAERHSDFESVLMSSGMGRPIALELAHFPDPGELGYYLASNPREIERLQKLPAYEMKRELARHMADMVRKNNITHAPPPIKPVGGGAANPVKHFAHKTISELKAERRAQLAGKSKRR